MAVPAFTQSSVVRRLNSLALPFKCGQINTVGLLKSACPSLSPYKLFESDWLSSCTDCVDCAGCAGCADCVAFVFCVF